MFAVAVSGGCGGGSSGHYYGDYGQDRNSSNDVTPESQDVIPENPVSEDQNGDDYGANNGNDPLYKFKLLNGSVWKITSIDIYGNGVKSKRKALEIVPNSFNYNTETITLATNNDSLTWYDGGGDYHIDPDDYLTVDVKDPDDGTQQTITILRITDGFKVQHGFEENNSTYRIDIPRNDGTDRSDTEIINCITMLGGLGVSDVAYQLQISFSCKGSNNQEYFSNVYLTRVDVEEWETNGHSVYSEVFRKLDHTEWTIKSVDVVGPNGKSRSIKKNTYNYDVSQITLLMYMANMNGDLSGGFTWLDGNNNPPRNNNNALTVNFSYGIFTTRTAPLLTPASGFKYKGRSSDGTLEFQTTLSNGNTETIFQHNWEISNLNERKTNPFVRVSHSFMINNQQYTANMLLVPAN